MPGREFILNGSYRYRFNGQEFSEEISTSRSHSTAKYWEYDGRLARRWNRDPKPTVAESEYAVNNGNPVKNNDPYGDTPGPGDGTTGSVSLTMNVGSTNNRLSLRFSLTQQVGNYNLSVGGGVSLNSTFNNTGKSGLEFRGSAMGGFDDGKTQVQLGTNFFRGTGDMKEFKQQTGILSLKFGKFTAAYENDGYPFPMLKLGDNGDRYRTAAVRLGYNDISAGFNLFTGSRTDYTGDNEKIGKMQIGKFGERMPNGFVKEDGPRYRMGVAYLGFGNAQLGINSDRFIRHPIQDMFAHNLRIPDTRQPGFESLSKSITPYFQLQTPNIFNSSVTKRFSLYE